MSDESSKFAEIEKSKMANSTPSSVLNELAKSNKVVALYQVVAESGPSHQKTYQVHLHIGVHGPYEGIGSNLKSARNAAASKALADGLQSLYLNPTVELNILSMKSGEQVVYKELTTSLPQQKVENFFVPHQFIQRDQRARVKCVNKLWKMSVTLCGRTYIGEGQTKSEARGNTASRALSELKPLLLEKAKRAELERLQQKITVNHEIDSSNVTYKSNSFVSDLYEKAVQHNFVIHFTTIHESGPPHVRFFHIKCIVGEKETVGEGVGKKNAKNNAAEKMLKVLEDSALLSSKNKEKKQFKKKVEEKKVNVALNPITYLTQLMQLRKEPPVIYVTKADMGPHQPGDMRFQIEASIADFKSIGYGSTKKVAKANAAMNLLKNLGIDLDEMKESQLQKAKNLPEVSLVKDINDKFSASIKPHGSPVVLGRSLNLNTLARLENFDSAKQKLEYIAQLEGFQLLFNDFVKNKKDNRGEFSSHLAIFTTPPELYQGSGDSVESSRENAASKALKAMFKNVEKTEEAAP